MRTQTIPSEKTSGGDLKNLSKLLEYGKCGFEGLLETVTVSEGFESNGNGCGCARLIGDKESGDRASSFGLRLSASSFGLRLSASSFGLRLSASSFGLRLSASSFVEGLWTSADSGKDTRFDCVLDGGIRLSALGLRSVDEGPEGAEGNLPPANLGKDTVSDGADCVLKGGSTDGVDCVLTVTDGVLTDGVDCVLTDGVDCVLKYASGSTEDGVSVERLFKETGKLK